ncbi:MAG: zinc ribbon domain-containing protein [Alphaproteobacteria bacterium]|nr:zinc ribbon domain-containing protein [Alphaproteobacteria bacterium]
MSIGSAYCDHCKKQVLAKKKGCNHIIHAILSILTGGIWLIIWLLCAITWDDWYCSQCGEHVKLGSKGPEYRCPKCGALISSESSFCSNCGQKVN